MIKDSKKQAQLLALLLLAVFLFTGSSILFSPNREPIRSVEVAVAEESFVGASGGAVIPASCPSYSHLGAGCNAEEGDMCFNLAGWQSGPPAGYFLYETPGVYRTCCPNGYTATTYSCTPPPTDVCPNIAGNQASVPAGYVLSGGNCVLPAPTDVCPNIAGDQASVPSGYTVDGSGNCVAPAPTDVCPNIAGNQASVPAGYVMSGGNCVTQASITNDPTLNCSPSTVASGGTVTCSWSCDTANGDTSSAGIGFSTGGGSSGTSGALTPTAPSTTYGVQCYPSGRQTTQTVSVIAPTLSISANPSRVRYDTASTIVWSASDVTGCTVLGPNISANTTSGSRSTGALRVQSVYTLTCQTAGGPRSATATVYITPRVCEVGTAGCPN